MSLLEAQVRETRELLSTVAARELSIDRSLAVAKGKIAGLILKNETYVELGNPDDLSAQVLLYTNDGEGDSVHIIGEDLENLQGKSVAFAEVVILRGEAIDAEVYYQFCLRHQRLLDFPGFMVKSTGGHVWVRAAVRDDVTPSYQRAAATLIERIHASFPAVKGVDVWFVTGDRALIGKLNETAQSLLTAATEMKEGVWKARGFDYKNCRISGHCGSCSDKKTCASVRGIEAKVKIHRRNESQTENN